MVVFSRQDLALSVCIRSHLNNYLSLILNLILDDPLAANFPLLDGSVEITVPEFPTGLYAVVCKSDSYSALLYTL